METHPGTRSFRLFLVCACLILTTQCGAQEQPTLDDLVKQIANDDPKVRARAARLLSARTEVEALPALFDALQDPYAHPWAVHGIYKHQNKEDLTELQKALTHRNPEARWRAVSMLGSVGDASVAQKVEPLLRDEHPKVRSWAAWALGKLKHKAAAPELLKLLDDPDPDVRSNAAYALAPMGYPEAEPALIKTLASEDTKVQRAAAQALGFYPSDASADAVKKLLKHEHILVRQQAVISLIRMGEKGLPAIREIVEGKDEALHTDLAIVCWQLCGPVSVGDSAKPALKLIAEKGPDDAKLSARMALWKLTGKVSRLDPPEKSVSTKDPAKADIEKLITDALSEDIGVQMDAAEQLKRIGTPVVPLILQRMEKLRNDEEHVFRDFSLQQAIVHIGPGAVPAVIRVLLNPHSRVRGEAAQMLGRIGDVSAVQALCDVLMEQDADPLGNVGNTDVRDGCIRALGEIGDRSAVPSLIAVLGRGGMLDGIHTPTVTEALGKIGDRSAIPALLLMLEGRSAAPRQGGDQDIMRFADDIDREANQSAAALGLGMLADPATLPALEDALRDAKGKLKRNIEKAIRRIKTVNE